MKELYEQRHAEEFGDIEAGSNNGIMGGLKLRGRANTGVCLSLFPFTFRPMPCHAMPCR
jgi:hypothetical protein